MASKKKKVTAAKKAPVKAKAVAPEAQKPEAAMAPPAAPSPTETFTIPEALLNVRALMNQLGDALSAIQTSLDGVRALSEKFRPAFSKLSWEYMSLVHGLDTANYEYTANFREKTVKLVGRRKDRPELPKFVPGTTVKAEGTTAAGETKKFEITAGASDEETIKSLVAKGMPEAAARKMIAAIQKNLKEGKDPTGMTIIVGGEGGEDLEEALKGAPQEVKDFIKGVQDLAEKAGIQRLGETGGDTTAPGNDDEQARDLRRKGRLN